jgi:hypothetical protein
MVIAKRQNAKAVCPMGSGAGFGGISHVNAGRFSSEEVSWKLSLKSFTVT